MLRKLAVVGLVVSCGGHSSSSGPDAAVDASPASELGALMPHAVAGDPTAILATPTVVAITYDNDTNRTDIEAFYHQYAASTAWTATTGEYGIGPLTVVSQHLAGNAPAKILDGDTSDITAVLTANLTGASPAWGAPNPNALYSFVYPAGSVVDDGTVAAPDPCCQSYDGYHFDAMIGGVDVAYAIQCQCGANFDPGMTPLQQLTIVMGHELVEAVTDPHISTTVGWNGTDDPHTAWTYVTSGELGDLCEFADTYGWLTPPGMTYATQRTWSNAAAGAGHDPCVGDPTTPYYQTIPDQPDSLSVAYNGNTVATKGVKIAIGASGMLQLHVLADDGSAGPFTISIDDLNSFFAGGVASGNPLTNFQIAQPAGTYHVGDTVSVPVKVLAADTMLTSGETVIITTKPSTGPATFYFAMIGQ